MSAKKAEQSSFIAPTDLRIVSDLIDDLKQKREERDQLTKDLVTAKKAVKKIEGDLEVAIQAIESIDARLACQETLSLFGTPAVTGVPKEAFNQDAQAAPEAMAAQQANNKNNQPITFSFAPVETEILDGEPLLYKELIIFVRGSEERHITTEEAEKRLLGKGPDGYATMELLFDSTLEAIGKLSEEQREEFYLSLEVFYQIEVRVLGDAEEDQSIPADVAAIFTRGPESRYLTNEILLKVSTESLSDEEKENFDRVDIQEGYLDSLPDAPQNVLEAVWQQLPAPEVSEAVASFFTPVEGQASAAATPSQVEGSSYLQNKFKLTRLEDGRIVLQHKNKSKVVAAQKVLDIEKSYDCKFEEIPESAMEDVWAKMSKAYKPQPDKKENPVTEEAGHDLDEIKFMHKSDGSIILTSSLRSKVVDADTIEKIRTIGLFIEEGNASVSISGEIEGLSLAQTRALFLSSYAKPYQKTESNVVGMASAKSRKKKEPQATI